MRTLYQSRLVGWLFGGSAGLFVRWVGGFGLVCWLVAWLVGW